MRKQNSHLIGVRASRMPRFLSDPDREAAGLAMEAMTKIGKIDIATLEAAFRR